MAELRLVRRMSAIIQGENTADSKRMWTWADFGPAVYRKGLAAVQEVLLSLPAVSGVSFNTPARQHWAAHFTIDLGNPVAFDVIRLLSLTFNRIDREGALPVLFRPVLRNHPAEDTISWTLAPYTPMINPALVARAIDEQLNSAARPNRESILARQQNV